MKKMITFICMSLLSLCLCVPAMAAASSPGTDVKPEEGTIVKGDGTTVDITDPEELKEYLDIREPSAAPETVEDYVTMNSFDVTLPSDVASAEVTLYVPGVKKGDVVMVRIFVDGQWVNVEAVVVDDNKVKVKLLHSGTVEILKLSSGQQPGDDPGDKPGSGDGTGSGTSSGGNTSATSPKTGEGAAFPAACILAVVAGGVALAAGYKAKKISE